MPKKKVIKATYPKTPVAPKATPKAADKKPTQRITGLTVQMFDISGKSAGTIALPKEVFGQTPNQNLLAQAIRVYQTNSIKHTAHTKTRGEVRGGGKKPWRQKGTGNARAGSTRSPLWVGGGITFGPRAREVKLSLPQKMKRVALISALSEKAKQEQIKVITNFEKVPPKTKPIASLLNKLNSPKDTLIVISEKKQNVKLATRNIPNISVDLVKNLNAYQVIKSRQMLISKDAINQFASK